MAYSFGNFKTFINIAIINVKLHTVFHVLQWFTSSQIGRGSESSALQRTLTLGLTKPSCWYINNCLSLSYSIVFLHPQNVFFTAYPQDPHSHMSLPLHLKSIVFTIPSVASFEQSGCSHINEPAQRPVFLCPFRPCCVLFLRKNHQPSAYYSM